MCKVDQPQEDDVCPDCLDGDRVPSTGYYHCKTCDAEWGVEDEDEET